jgi:putative FmdB family regulatory protein
MRRLYDYQCQSCGHTKEALRDSNDDSYIECPECKGIMDRVISVPKVIMAGGTEGQALKGIQEIQKKDNSRKLYF